MATGRSVDLQVGRDGKVPMITRILTCAVLLATVMPVAAQSLAAVARAEEARRKAVKGQAKVYTNDTLRGADGGAAPPPPIPASASSPATTSVPAPAGTPAAGDANQPGASAGSKPAAPGAANAADEKYWRDRVTVARSELSRSQTFAGALQSHINALYTEFVNMSDPAQRSVIAQKRLAAIAEQDRVNADIVKQTKAIADIEDEARRVNVPAGWLR
jgi:hypothetical protein